MGDLLEMDKTLVLFWHHLYKTLFIDMIPGNCSSCSALVVVRNLVKLDRVKASYPSLVEDNSNNRELQIYGQSAY